MKQEEMADFIRTQTVLEAPSFVPEISLYLATQITPLWQLSEERLRSGYLPPPFWAFAWPGGQGMARYILDNPALVNGKSVMDFAAGCGLAAIAAVKAGAKHVMADDIDLLAQTAIYLNAEANDVEVEVHRVESMEKPFTKADLIIIGDVCYQQAMATTIMRWAHLCLEKSIRVLLSDPGRAYVPKDGLKELARYEIPTSLELEDRTSREVVVWELMLPA